MIADRPARSIAAGVVVLAVVGVVAAAGIASGSAVPHAFYGAVNVNGEPAADGTEIVAEIDGEVRGSITVDSEGQYGGSGGFEEKLEVSGDESDAGATIEFRIDGQLAEQTATWESGGLTELDLSIGDAPTDGSADGDEPRSTETPADDGTSAETDDGDSTPSESSSSTTETPVSTPTPTAAADDETPTPSGTESPTEAATESPTHSDTPEDTPTDEDGPGFGVAAALVALLAAAAVAVRRSRSV